MKVNKDLTSKGIRIRMFLLFFEFCGEKEECIGASLARPNHLKFLEVVAEAAVEEHVSLSAAQEVWSTLDPHGVELEV